MWQITYKKAFLRELKKLPKGVRARVEEFVFDLLPTISDLSDVPELKKLIGYPDYYRIRFGEYRLGLQIDQEEKIIACCRILHRREIYRFFP